MATIAEQLVGSALENSTKVPDIAGHLMQGIQTGAALAQQAESIRENRQKLEMAKQEHDMAKWVKFADLAKTGADMPEGKNKNDFNRKILPQAGAALLGNQIHQDVMGMVSNDPNVPVFLKEQVDAKQMSPDEAKMLLADPEKTSGLIASEDYKKYLAAKSLKPVEAKLSPAAQDGKTIQGLDVLRSSLRDGTLSLAKIRKAQIDPAAKQSLLSSTGLDKFGGEATLNDILETYPKALADAEKEGIQNVHQEKVKLIGVGPQSERTEYGIHKDALNEVNDKSSNANKKLSAYQTIANAYQEYEASGHSGQALENFQTQVRLNQGATGGRTGVSERAAAHASSLGISKDLYIQIATGEIQDTQKSSPGIVKAIKEVAETEMSLLKKQAFEGVDKKALGYKNFYKKHPDLAEDADNNIKAFKDQFTSPAGLEQINVFGSKMSVDQAKQFFKSHPQFSPDAETKKALGM